MHLLTDHIIEKIREYAQEFDSHRYEIFKLELWWYPETETVEGFKITSSGSTLTKNDIKQIPVGDAEDIDNLVAERFHSLHLPQEQELEKEEEEEIGRPQGSPLQKDTVPAKSPRRGGTPNSEELLRKILIDKLSQLTDKQRFAVLLMCLNCTNRQASKVMRINESTYREHLEIALRKLHIP